LEDEGHRSGHDGAEHDDHNGHHAYRDGGVTTTGEHEAFHHCFSVGLSRRLPRPLLRNTPEVIGTNGHRVFLWTRPSLMISRRLLSGSPRRPRSRVGSPSTSNMSAQAPSARTPRRLWCGGRAAPSLSVRVGDW